jgi:hypothetical protein
MSISLVLIRIPQFFKQLMLTGACSIPFRSRSVPHVPSNLHAPSGARMCLVALRIVVALKQDLHLLVQAPMRFLCANSIDSLS